MKILKKQILPILLVFSTVLLGACGKDDDNLKKGTSTSDSKTIQAKGRYLEEEVSLPDQTGYIMAIKRMENNVLRLVTDSGIYDSEDNGDTWSKTEIGAQLYTESYSVGSADIDSKGNVILVVYHFGDSMEDYTIEYHYLDKDGEDRVLDIELDPMDFGDMSNGKEGEEAPDSIQGMDESEDSMTQDGQSEDESDMDVKFNQNDDMENAIQTLSFADNGDVIGMDYNSTMLQIDPLTGEIKNTLKNDDYISELVACGNKVLLKGMNNTLEVYNTETLQLEDSYPALSDFFAAQNQGAEGNMNINYGVPSSLMKVGLKEDSLLYTDHTGLYQYTFGGTVVEQIINGTTNSLGNMESNATALEQLDENTYLAGFMDIQGGTAKLLKYTYSGEADSTPSAEINVYSLKDDQTLRQVISKFQQNNPDILVNLQIGMSEGQTLSDTLRTLNTNIMSGKGPDIIILDGMPINNYIDKNLLEDISDLVDDVDKSEGLYGDIAKAFEKDKKIYAVPTRFAIPTIVGDPAVLDGIKDAGTLADQLEGYPEASDQPLLTNTYTAKEYLKSTLSYAYDILKEDGTLDEGALKAFLEASKRGYKGDIRGVNPEEIDGMKTAEEEKDSTFGRVDLGAGLMTEKQILDMGNMSTMESYATMVAANKKTNSGYQTISSEDKQLFAPNLMAGINSKSKQLDAAKDFVKAMLTEEFQSIRVGEGFPVNQKAFEAICNPPREDYMMAYMLSDSNGASISLEVTWPTDDELSEIKELVKKLDTPLNYDSTIQEAIMGEGAKCLEGELTVDEATANILKTVQLYLSEQ
ncbi:MAG TPA: extracellular solute-binding protein [Candidatus Pelethocola excrementipullorum]|nr:extracellular solute-binding protein [Candidatus Pelethocola excrementipullorum]